MRNVIDLVGTQIRGDAMVDYMIGVTINPKFSPWMIRETLSRIGHRLPNEQVIDQIAHMVLHDRKVYIGHYKQCHRMYTLKPAIITAADVDGLVGVVYKLQSWGVLTINNPDMMDGVSPMTARIYTIPRAAIGEWRTRKHFYFPKRDDVIRGVK